MKVPLHGATAGDRPYRIGDLSRLLAIPPSAIRYYEEQGLVDPDKDWQNNYRAYYTADGCRILASRIYRSMGFSVEETRRLVTECGHQDIEAALEARKSEVDRHIARLQQLSQTLAEVREEARRMPTDIQGPRVWNRPAFYRVGGGRNNFVSLDDSQAAVAHRWLNYLPATRTSFAIPQAALDGGEPFSCTWGYALRADDFDDRGEVFSSPMEFYPAAPCLWAVIEKVDFNDFGPDHFRFLTDRMTALGLRTAGPGLGFNLEILHEDGCERVRFGISIPFIDNSKVILDPPPT